VEAAFEIKGNKMCSFKFRSALVALVAVMAAAVSSARADSGTIRINVFKGGWFVGASGGAGKNPPFINGQSG
jgi:hypothetical protein